MIFGFGMSFIEFFNMFLEKLTAETSGVLYNRTFRYIDNLFSGIFGID